MVSGLAAGGVFRGRSEESDPESTAGRRRGLPSQIYRFSA